MPTRVDEPITVSFAVDGEPRSFIWRRFEYEVVGVPQAFFQRRKWWQQQSDLSRIDRAMWRVDATSSGRADDIHTFDLASGPAGEEWILMLAWE